VENSILERVKSFKDWFHGYEDNYLIIGGTACSLLLSEQGETFRATKDVDVVLILEVMNADFGYRFWEYIIDAGYQHCNKSTGKPQYYRFFGPKSNIYPEMIELFSRNVEGFILPDSAVITPIPMEDDISSLSAILLNDHYYSFLRDGVRKVGDLPVLDELYIIPFKAKAWLDLSERRSRGERVDNTDINKHKRDIYRLLDIVIEGSKLDLPEYIKQDMQNYLATIKNQTENTPRKEQPTEREKISLIETIYGL
jgi:hypothetical protein